MIVNKGKELLARYLSGLSGVWAGSLEFGVGTTPVTVTDESLVFPVVRVPIELLDYDAATFEITARCTLPDGVIGEFYEVGVFSDEDFPEQQVGNQLLLDYTGNDTVYSNSNAGLSAANARVGPTGTLLSVPNGGTGVAKGFLPGLDLSDYSGNDVINLAYHFTNTGGIPTVSVRFESDDTDYFEYTFVPTAGYNIESVPRSSFVTVGTPSWDTLGAVRVAVDSQADLLLDGLVVEDTINIESYGMISRVVLNVPIIKAEFTETEVTFKLSLGF